MQQLKVYTQVYLHYIRYIELHYVALHCVALRYVTTRYTHYTHTLPYIPHMQYAPLCRIQKGNSQSAVGSNVSRIPNLHKQMKVDFGLTCMAPFLLLSKSSPCVKPNKQSPCFASGSYVLTLCTAVEPVLERDGCGYHWERYRTTLMSLA